MQDDSYPATDSAEWWLEDLLGRGPGDPDLLGYYPGEPHEPEDSAD